MLKALELRGFKSFADRTRFDFPPGITVVVGPNGSGKSNIVDGLKWVLGEQSAKSLRGKDMADVIFKGGGGSSGRKAGNSAEATIVLENSDRRFPYDSDDINVTRRVYRSGESEFLINNEPVRLRDIKDLFRGTGVGTDAYSVIEQGKVDRMLQSNPKDRRAIFEEAAGISRFKSKKIETQRRLGRVEQNLVRLADIVEEVGSRYRSVKAQASKAARYRQYTNRLKLLRTHVANHDYVQFHETLRNLTTEGTQLTDALEEAQNSDQQDKEDSEKLAAAAEEIQNRLTTAQDELASLRERLAAEASESSIKKQQFEELTGRISRLGEQLESTKNRIGQYQLELSGVEKDLDQIGSDHFDLKEKLESEEPKVEQLSARQAELDSGHRESRNQQSKLVELLASVGSKLQSMTSEKETARQSADQKTQEKDSLGLQLDELAQQALTFQGQEQELRQKAEEKDSVLAELNRKIETWRSDLDTVKSKKAELEKQQSGDQERSKVLKEMESRLEGVNLGVKSVLSSAAAGEGPFADVVGLVADLVHVNMQHANLIDLALGEVSQYIVTKGNRLRDSIASEETKLPGRVGFLPIEEPNSLGAEVTERLKDLPSVIGRADFFVQARDGYDDFVARLLGGTWIVKTLSDAIQLRGQGNRHVRFVSMAGEVIESDGRLVVGARAPASNLVSRRSELRLLASQLQQRQEEIDQNQTQIADLQDQLKQGQDQQKSLLAEQKELSFAWNDAKDQFAKASAKKDQVSTQLDRLAPEIEALLEKIHSLDSFGAELLIDQAKNQETSDQLSAQISEMESQKQELSGQQSQVAREITSLKVRIAKVEQRLEQLEGEKKALGQTLSERNESLEEIQVDLEKAAGEQKEIQDRLEVLQNSEQEAETKKVELESSFEEVTQKKEEIDEQRAVIVDRLERHRNHVRKLEKRKYQVEVEANQLSTQLETMLERMRDDYGLEVQDILDYQPHGQPAIEQLREVDDEEAPEEGEVDLDDESEEEEQDEVEDGPGEGGEEGPVDAEGTQEDSEISSGTGVTELAVSPRNEEVDPKLIVSQDRDEVDSEIASLRRKINSIGAVNLDALAELEELEGRYNNLSGQYNDLVSAKEGLEKIIERINADSRKIFAETLEIIRQNFQQLYRKTFGGGHADIVLEQGEDILECGVEIVATPPGKSEFSNSLLSGGEKALTAVSLLMAIFKYRPSPFCVLDEVDAPFDEANIGRFLDVLKDFLGWTRFVIVTHSKKTMTAATTLYGVTMQESGISKRVSIKFEEVTEDGHIVKDDDGKEDEGKEDEG